MSIQEDYVSFETAKLLKEKGFNGECSAAYNGNGKLYKFNEEVDDNTPYWSDAPTLQMAMKYLREVHNIYIEISISCDREDKNAKIFDASIFNIQNIRYKKLCNIQGYEQACENAVKYVLENLI